MTTNSIVLNHVENYADLKRRIETLNAQLREEREFLTKHLAQAGKREILVGGYKVRNTEVQVTRFDVKKFQEEQPAVYEQYCVKSTTERFEVRG